MLIHTTPISCNFISFNPQNPNQNPKHPFLKTSTFPLSLKTKNSKIKFPLFTKRVHLQICQDSLNTQKSQDPDLEQKNSMKIDGESGGNGGGGDGGRTTSFLIFLLWGGLMYYVLRLAPNQTPSTDMYLVKKLCFLIGDDGFQLNQVIVSLWNIMGLWPLLYCMLLIPSGRSSKGNVPVFPFLIVSFFLGAYALIPYFVLWRPPPPVTEETEFNKWPLNFLESKLTAGVIFAVGLGLIVNAGLATGDNWKEYFQYFGGSRLIHATSVDFALLSSFAPFWVYNDMTARKCKLHSSILELLSSLLLAFLSSLTQLHLVFILVWASHITPLDFNVAMVRFYVVVTAGMVLPKGSSVWCGGYPPFQFWTNHRSEKGFWLLPLSVVPFLGPALYVLLRPSLSAVAVGSSLAASKEE